MVDRQRIVDALALRPERGQRPARRVPGAGCKLIAVRQHAAFRTTGRAGGVEHTCFARCADRIVARRALQCRQVRERIENRDRRDVRTRIHPGGQLLAALARDQHEFDFGVLQQICDLVRPIVGIDRHSGHAERVERQLVQEMLRPVVEQHRDAMAVAVSGRTIDPGQATHLARRAGKIDLESVLVVRAMRARRHGQKRPRAVGLRGAGKCLADRGPVVERDHRRLASAI